MEIKLIIFLITPALIISGFLLFASQSQEPISPEETISRLLTIQGNSLLSWSPLPSPRVVKKVEMVATAYSSTVQQTDDTPYITAAGTWVRDGIVANNLLPFGTKIKIPELYGDKIFVVEDRMNSKKGYYHIDIWFPSYREAKNFGAKRTYVEILES